MKILVYTHLNFDHLDVSSEDQFVSYRIFILFMIEDLFHIAGNQGLKALIAWLVSTKQNEVRIGML